MAVQSPNALLAGMNTPAMTAGKRKNIARAAVMPSAFNNNIVKAAVMPSASEPVARIGLAPEKPYRMMGDVNQVNPTSPTNGYLPPNYGFNDLATYEENRRKAFGTDIQGQVEKLRTGIQGQYDTALSGYRDLAAKRRADLASSLSQHGKQAFELQNPSILEDLNNRGVFTSPTAVSQAQAQALKEIELANQERLFGFDAEQRAYEDALANKRLEELNNLQTSGVSGNLQSQQDALDAALDLRRGKLEGDLQERQASQEQSLAERLADKQSKNNLNNALIGAGGSILGAGLAPGGFLSSVLGQGAVGTAGTATGTGAAAGGAGAGGLAAAGAGVAAGLGTYEEGRKLAAGSGFDKNTSKLLGSQPALGLPVTAVDKLTGGTISKTINKAFGPGKTGVNVGDQQRGMNEMFGQANEIKAALANGQLDQESYKSYMTPLLQNAILLYHQTASQGSKAANNIRQNFNQFLQAGLIKQTGPDSYAPA